MVPVSLGGGTDQVRFSHRADLGKTPPPPGESEETVEKRFWATSLHGGSCDHVTKLLRSCGGTLFRR